MVTKNDKFQEKIG